METGKPYWINFLSIVVFISIITADVQDTSNPCRDVCDCEPTIGGQNVNCIGNGLPTLPEGLPLDTVQLNVRDNNIDNLDLDVLKALSNLEGLDVSGNIITAIRGSFEQFPKLTQIQLYNNKLTTLDSKTFGKSITWIHYVALYDNPWNCDCNLRWMKSQMDSNESPLSPQLVKCQTPEELHGNYTSDVDEDMFVCKQMQGLSQQHIMLISGLSSVVLVAVVAFGIFRGCQKPPVLGLVDDPNHQRQNEAVPVQNVGMAGAPNPTSSGTAPKSVLGQFRQRLPDEEDSRLLYQSS